MREIKSQTKTVRELFANTKYNLDYYQREYVWRSEHVKELIDDLTDAFSTNYKSDHIRQEVSNYTHYFLGSIVICEKDDKRFIIDGQQRLTTLTLLLIHLDRWLEEEHVKSPLPPLIFSESYGKESYNLDIPERISIMDSLRSGDDENFFSIKGQPESIQNIKLRYEDIKGCFKLPENHALLHFIDWLLGKVYLVEITAYDDLNAYTIFETMNDRGLSLTPTAMLRGYLLSNIDDTECRNHAIEAWRRQVALLQSVGNGEDSDAVKAWLRSQYLEINIDFERIGSEFHRWVRNRSSKLGLTSSTAFANFIEGNFKFYSGWYCRLRKASKDLTPGLESVYYNAQNNFTLQYPVLLSPLCVDDTEEDILNKIRIGATYLDILIHRRIWNSEDISQRTMVDSMCLVMQKIRGKSCRELRDILHTSLQAETKPFANNSLFGLHGGNKRRIQMILARMTHYVECQSGNFSDYTEYMKAGKNSYEVQHVWANHPEWYVEDFPYGFEFEAYRNRIGGLLLLPQRTSVTHNDLPYIDKLSYYANQKLLVASLHEAVYEDNLGFQQFCRDSDLPFRPHTEFKKVDLDDRQQLYLKLAEHVWSPERLDTSYSHESEIIIQTEISHASQPNEWTGDTVRALVPRERRENYETQYKRKVGEFYKQVAELQNLVRQTEWKQVLTLKFQRDYCGFYLGRKPIFGVNLYGAPRFAIWITEEEAEKFRNQCEFEAYYPQATYAIYPKYATLDALFPILEFAYRKQRGY